MSGSARSGARAAGTRPAALDEQWRSLDSLIEGMARRVRSHVPAGSDEDEEASGAEPATPAASAQLHALRSERDQLRRLLAATNAELRAARAEIRALTERIGGAAPSAPPPTGARVLLAQWWSRWSLRLR